MPRALCLGLLLGRAVGPCGWVEAGHRFQLCAWTCSELRGLDHHHVSARGLRAPGYHCVLLLLLPPEEEPEARQER